MGTEDATNQQVKPSSNFEPPNLIANAVAVQANLWVDRRHAELAILKDAAR